MLTDAQFQTAERLYEEQLRPKLEQSHRNWFVAIEPESGGHALGRTLEAAFDAARATWPGHQVLVLRVGHRATIEIGAWSQ